MRFLTFLAVVMTCSHPIYAQAPAGFQTSAEEGILIDAATGAVLFEKQADKLFPPASMSKIMTLTLLFKKLKAGEISLKTEFPVSQHAWRTGGAPSRTTAMFIPLNTTATVADLIQGIAVQNANDACIAVAEGLSGTEDAFAQAMTEASRELGLDKSTFANATGLPNDGNRTTARELAQIAMHLVTEYPDYYGYFAQKEFKYRTHNFRNLNPLIESAAGIDGLKLGFTDGAGYGVVASALKDGRRLFAVLNGFKSDKDRKEETLRILNWGFVNFKAFRVFDVGEVVGEARVWGAQKRHIPVKAKTDVKILLPISAKTQNLKGKIVYKGPLKPPVKEGDKVGDLQITSDSGTSNSAPVYAAEDLEEGGLVTKGIDSLVFLAFGWVL